MGKPILGRQIGKEICDALGLERTIDIKIHIPLEGVVEIDVKYYPDQEHMEKLLPVLQKYNLIPKEI